MECSRQTGALLQSSDMEITDGTSAKEMARENEKSARERESENKSDEQKERNCFSLHPSLRGASDPQLIA